jgi:hypothetical protein
MARRGERVGPPNHIETISLSLPRAFNFPAQGISSYSERDSVPQTSENQFNKSVKDSSVYTSVIFQHMLSNPVVSEDSVLDLVAQIQDSISGAPAAKPTQDELAKIMADISDVIRPYHYALKRSLMNIDRNDVQEFCWILYNTGPDLFHTIAASFTPAQLVFLKTLFSAIAESSALCIDEIEALNLTLIDSSGVSISLSKTDRESFIRNLIEAFWLQKNDSNSYDCNFRGLRIGVRAAAELAGYLEGECLLSKCDICRSLVTNKRLRCSNDQCIGSVHLYCLQRMQAAGVSQTMCSLCSRPYNT